MSIHHHEKIYEGDTVRRTVTSLIYMRAAVAGVITEIDIYAFVSLGTATFNVRLNGVQQFVGGARPSITVGSHAQITGLSIAVVEGDEITLDVDSSPTSNIPAPIVFLVHIDDQVVLGSSNSWDQTIVKPVTTLKASDTVLAADPHLKFNIIANQIYAFEGRIWIATAGSGVAMKFRHNFTQVPVGSRVTMEYVSSTFLAGGTSIPNTGSFSTQQTGSTLVIGASQNFDIIDLRGYVQGHATLASVFEFQWAQNVSNATAMQVELGSVLSYKKV